MAENEKVEQSVPSAPKAEKAKKDKKSDKKSKPGVFARIGRWFRELKIELKKVVWPTGKQTVNNTLIVIACVKSDKKSKPGVFARIGRWFRELKIELKKVVWPTGKQTVNNTLIVIACVIVVGIFIWLFDAVAGGLIQALFHLVNG